MTAVRVLAWIHTLLGGAALLVGTLVCLGLAADPKEAAALYYIGPIFVIFAAFYFAPGFLGGVGLLRGKAWGRWVILALSFLLLLAIPVGTVLGGFGLWALLRKAGLPPAPATPAPVVMRPRPSGEAKRTLDTLVIMAGTGSAMFIALTIGFWAHHDTPPAELRGLFWLSLPVFAAVVVYVVIRKPFAGWGAPVFTYNPIERARWRRKARRNIAEYKAALQARVEKLSADPALRPYAERLAAGEYWSDEQIAYDREPRALATCRHLQPIEQAMRSEGFAVRLSTPPHVRCNCRIDEAGLWARFPPGRRLTYVERFRGGRAVEDDPEAYILCDACQAGIETVHPHAVRGEVPWFPDPPDQVANMTGG
jgi:hypothetical protein